MKPPRLKRLAFFLAIYRPYVPDSARVDYVVNMLMH